MMLESLNGDLDCHRHAPDKTPARRLATLEAAGELAIPFTTGHPRRHRRVPPGPPRRAPGDRRQPPPPRPRPGGHRPELPAQAADPDAPHARRRRPTSTAGRSPRPACVLPADVHLQAPPNLSDDFGTVARHRHRRLGRRLAGHRRPRQPGAAVARPRRAAPRHRGPRPDPRAAPDDLPRAGPRPERWLDPALHFPVLDRSDAEGLGRDDPGAHHPERVSGTRDTGDGAEVVLVGDRSTAWYSGAPVAPPMLVPAAARRRRRRRRGARRRPRRPGARRRRARHAVRRPRARGRRRRRARPTSCAPTPSATPSRGSTTATSTTPTCARSSAGSAGSPRARCRSTCAARPYLLTLDDIAERVAEAWDRGATEVTLQGGIHPSFDGDYYIDVTRAVKAAAPGHPRPRLHRPRGHRGRQAPRRAARRVPRPPARRRPRQPPRHGRRDPRRRRPAILCPDKITTDEWLDAHETAHARRAALERHDHVRRRRAAGPLGPPPRADPRPAAPHRRLHRVRAPAVRAHGGADLPAAPGPPRARRSARRC